MFYVLLVSCSQIIPILLPILYQPCLYLDWSVSIDTRSDGQCQKCVELQKYWYLVKVCSDNLQVIYLWLYMKFVCIYSMIFQIQSISMNYGYGSEVSIRGWPWVSLVTRLKEVYKYINHVDVFVFYETIFIHDTNIHN